MPELFDLRVKARSLAFLFIAGALLGLLTLVFPHDERVHDPELVLVATVAIGVGTVVWIGAGRMREWQLHVSLAIGTLLITLANYWAEGTALYPVLYTWAVLSAFYLFALPAALAHLALVGVAYAVLLGIQEPPSPVVHWLLAVGTPAVAGLLISRLLRRLRSEATLSATQARALIESEERTRLLLESAPDVFLAIDPDGVVTAWNSAAERTFGWTSAEAVGERLTELIFPPEGRAQHDERRKSLFADPDPVTGRQWEVELQRRDGTRFPGETTASRVRIGDAVVLAAFVRDMSERRRREQEREALLREQAARTEAERVAQTVSRIQELVDAALSHRRLGEILEELVPRVQRVVGCDCATVFLAEEGELLRVAASTGSRPAAEVEPLAFGEGLAGQVAASRTPMLVQDPPPGEVLDPTLDSLDVGSAIAVPLLGESEVTGVIAVYAEVPRRFSDEDLVLLGLAGERVALAIENARIYEREHRIAETLQRSLLPEHMPRLPGLEVAARYQPAAAEAEVGGDWYDVIPIPGGAVGLVMGDVAGKGLSAASMVGRLRSAVRAYALEGHGPEAVVDQLNRLVWTELDESQMATLIYVVLDPTEGEMRWVNAGHLPPLLVVGDRLPHFLEGGRSVPLGVLPFPSFEEVCVTMDPDGTVLLYTDGLVEQPGEHIDDGLARLAEHVRRAPAEPERLLDHLLKELVPAGGASDDVALLALQSTPVPDHLSVELPAEPATLASMRNLMRRWLRHADGTDQEIAEITTACGEAATNAIEHAGPAGDTPFEVDAQLDGREVRITVRDFGSWREPREGDHGRGISLMRALMDDVDVTPSPEGTTVRLGRTLNGDNSPE